MAVAAYFAWDKLGRPLTPAQPIREFVEKCKVAFPLAAAENLFSWYADDAHYQSNFPEDHTPYSVTGWPVPCPQWWVCATDVMHRPDLGVDCDVLVPYWIGEAKAGRMPWLKYVIWKAQLYDVRNGFKPVANSGHFDHSHVSSRTDHLETSLGGWSVTGSGATTTGDPDVILIVQKGTGATYTYNGKDRVYQGNPDVVKALVGIGTPMLAVDDVTQYGIEFDPKEFYADRDAMRAHIAAGPGSGGGTGSSHDELAQAAFEGAQRAERE